MGYFNKLEKKNTVELQFFRDKSFFKAPESISVEELQKILKAKEYYKLPDPHKDLVWLFHPFLNKDNVPSPKRNKTGSIRGSPSISGMTRSVDSHLQLEFIPESKAQADINRRHEKGSKRIRELMDAISFDSNRYATEFSWMCNGRTDISYPEIYKAFGKQCKLYKEKTVYFELIQEKLRYLLRHQSPLLVDKDTYISFYHMVLNEIKLNGREKLLKLISNSLDNYVNSIVSAQVKHDVRIKELPVTSTKQSSAFKINQIRPRLISQGQRLHELSSPVMRDRIATRVRFDYT